jgi:putative alpha-1,2-mannosidase
MPELDNLKTAPDDRKLPFTHADEIARPDYYSVSLQADATRHIRTEMTATTHCGYLRFTFPADRASIAMVEASRPGIDGFAQVNAAKREIVGYNPDRMDSGLGPLKLPNFKGYFVIQFRQSFSKSGTYGMGPEDSDKARGAYAQFHTRLGEVVEARVGTSFISIEQARANLQAEIPDWNFEKVRLALRETWNDKLRRVSLEAQVKTSSASSTRGCTTRCCIRVSSPSRAATIARSTTPCTRVSPTPLTPSGTPFALRTAC